MLDLLWLVPTLPLGGFVLLALGGRLLGRSGAAWVGVGSVGAAAVLMTAIGVTFLRYPAVWVEPLWTWMSIGTYEIRIGLDLDALSLAMSLVVVWVSFLIHLYSVEFMGGDEGFVRFFAYMNLFVASMLLLLLAGDLLFLLVGWEGVGLCSYLLIGFWYRDPNNGYAARKAFVVTRIGDTSLLVGLLLLATHFDTLDTRLVAERAVHSWPVGAFLPNLAAALVLGGAVGKSAQLPLQTWLPDAMAGPTPVSALIHAATMVTAGVYLIARMNLLFTLAPAVQAAVAVIGAATLLLAGLAALGQHDLKRVLAYSTISQIGYMFLALGVGAWSAAIFHFLTHACFKALLFLAAGAVILSLEGEHDIFKMGGLRRVLPLTFWTFLVASASLAGLPLVTAGFFSKDLILEQTLASPAGGVGLWVAGLVGVVVTGLYIFRVVFLVFFGEPGRVARRAPGKLIQVPLVVLAVLSVVAGYLETPSFLGNVKLWSTLLHQALPITPRVVDLPWTGYRLEYLGGPVAVVGIGLSAYFFYLRPAWLSRLYRSAFGQKTHRWLAAGEGFDWLYQRALVKPFVNLAMFNRHDFVDWFYVALAHLNLRLGRALGWAQTGKLRTYAAGLALGTVVVVAIVVLR